MAPRQRRRGWRDVDKSDILVSDLVRGFLMNQEDRNHSPKTVRWYSEMLGRLQTALGEDARLRDLDGEAIRDYQRGLRRNDLSKFTLHAYLEHPGQHDRAAPERRNRVPA